ncbi:TetR family transcriptional regulator [Kribbella sp. NBC_01245]|uniref:TetR/AcrR family transcriptional regulator n=1 Tax=Kribbella sp. NBC_01245 TaxID=2903578 RepID=UPI002E28BCA7|nr:TetR family transcriptional regulator [Kribbella sp. NBC_01245]
MGTEPIQTRSRQRRDALLDAAIELLAEGGGKSVTHRAVAIRAGLPPSTATYFFASIQELTEQALARHLQARVTEIEAAMEALFSQSHSLEDVADLFAAFFLAQPREAAISHHEVYLEASRNPSLRAAVADALQGFERLATSVLTTLHVAEPERASVAFLAAVDGFILRQLADPRPHAEAVRQLSETLRHLFIAFTLDPPERAAAQARLATPQTFTP